ncbi:hypothetical protein ACFY05_07885 [Microtetraspora fusca]|uniref:Uncharacterized protein n=1 Tax=Microtetraspora fusca TaxID=1997 RepID=A0ABW6V4G6_MICFU
MRVGSPVLGRIGAFRAVTLASLVDEPDVSDADTGAAGVAFVASLRSAE